MQASEDSKYKGIEWSTVVSECQPVRGNVSKTRLLLGYMSYQYLSHRHVPAPKPPIFRLPAELRNQIWQYIYGTLTIHVDLPSFNKPAKASHKNLTYTVHQKPFYPFNPTSVPMLPPICKQFYQEIAATFWQSAIFSFTAPQTFRAFALSPHACVSRVRHLEIPQLTQRHWDTALNAALVGQLTSLRGVTLAHEYWRCDGSRPIPAADDANWKPFWRMISAFQQHRLVKRETGFKIVVYDAYKNLTNGVPTGSLGIWADRPLLKAGDDQWENLLRLETDLTSGLLEYSPRRLSRRVAGRE